MREAAGNPALEEFGHLLPESGRYPARWVDIFWNSDDDLRIQDVEVVFIPRGAGVLPEGPEEGTNFWGRYARYNRGWMSDLGNSLNGWMEADGETPEGIFGHLLERGFTSKDELQRAVEEFAHIEECEWARRMAKAFERPEY